MSTVRQAFDLHATFVVASESVVCGPNSQRFMRGEVIPLRDLGFDDLGILHLWSALSIDCQPATAAVDSAVVEPAIEPVVTQQPTSTKQQASRREKR